MTSLPTILLARVVASARRRGLPYRKLADSTLFVGRDPVVSMRLSPASLGVRIDLSGPVPSQDVGAARDLMDRLLAAEPAPTISLTYVDEPEGEDSEAETAEVELAGAGSEEEPDGGPSAPPAAVPPAAPPEPRGPQGPAATGRLHVRVEAVTPVKEGMTDAQLDAYLSWATALTDRCAAAFETALPLTRAEKADEED